MERRIEKEERKKREGKKQKEGGRERKVCVSVCKCVRERGEKNRSTTLKKVCRVITN